MAAGTGTASGRQPAKRLAAQLWRCADGRLALGPIRARSPASWTWPTRKSQPQACGRPSRADLVEAKQTVPHFYLTVDIELDALLAMRKQVNAAVPEGVKISVNDMIILASAKALIDEPDTNASWAGDAILKYQSADVADRCRHRWRPDHARDPRRSVQVANHH